MEIQNISGTDLISSGFSVNTSISSENVKPEKEPENENRTNKDETKGTHVDTWA